MSTATAPQQRNGAAMPPPPVPILQKQSSFSKKTTGAPAPAKTSSSPISTQRSAAANSSAPNTVQKPVSVSPAHTAPAPNAIQGRPQSQPMPAQQQTMQPQQGAAKQPMAQPANSTAGRTPAAQPAPPGGAPPGAGAPPGMARQGSFGQGQMMRQGSFGQGQGPFMYPMGPMGPYAQNFGSMGPGQMSTAGNPNNMGMGQQFGSMMMGGPMGMGMNSFGGGPMGMGSMMGPMGYPGSMYMGGPAGSSMMGAPGMGMSAPFGGSMMGDSMTSSVGSGMMGGPMGSMYHPMGSMYRPMGSMYGMMGGMPMSAYGFTAQWGSLANSSHPMSTLHADRSSITSGYGGFSSEANGFRGDDICPVIGSYDDGKTVKRSGRRGGNHLYNRNKNDKSAPVVTSNSKTGAMTIVRAKSDAEGSRNTPGASPAIAPRAAAGGNKLRAKIPSNYDVHTLVIADKGKGTAAISVKDPNSVVLEKSGKKETFEVDEALYRESTDEEVESILLSELRGNWFGGHNCSLLMTAGKGKFKDSVSIVHAFIKKCVTRLEKEPSTKFDITINMCAMSGAEEGCDLLKSGASYGKLTLASSPLYGPCLLDLETKVVRDAKECVGVLDKGIAAAKKTSEIIVAFLVLKQIRSGSSNKDITMSSLCLGYFQEDPSHLIGLKEKSSGSPHRLFRYAVGGASACTSALCIADDDASRSHLEAERKIREVKNKPPRSGNVQRFLEFTQKEVARSKEKIDGASGTEKKQREAQVKRMEMMIKDIQELIANPEETEPKGYSFA